MRVLLVNDYPPRSGSGTEVHMLRLASGLEAAGDSVRVFAHGASRQGISRIRDVWDPASRKVLRLLEDEFRPDVVHFHNVVRELSPSVFGAPRRAARVLTIHDLRLLGVPDGPSGTPFDSPMMRWAKMARARVERVIARREMDAVIAPTRASARLLDQAGFERIHEVPHFAEVGEEPKRLPSAGRAVVVAGRLSPEKGVHVVVDAFGRIAARRPDAELVIVGDGPERPALERLASRSSPGMVRFTGLVDEARVREEMADARVVVAPSLALEGAGLTVLEAALAGRPIVVSDDPAQRELVDEANCGIVTPRGDAAAIADALGKLFDDGDLADRLGSAGRRTAVATRSIEVGVRRTKAVYAGAAARPRIDA